MFFLLSPLTHVQTLHNPYALIHRASPETEREDAAIARPYASTLKLFSPGRQVTFNGFTSYQVNVDATGQNIVGDAANEPSMVINPHDHNDIAVGWRQFDSVNSSFRQGGFAASLNGGRTWSPEGNLQPGMFRSDPVLMYSNRANHMLYDSLYVPNGYDYEDIWTSLAGFTWTNHGQAYGADKPWIAVDNTHLASRGNIYQVTNSIGGVDQVGDQYNVSVDGGATWTAPTALPNFPVFGTVAVSRTGNVYVAGTTQDPFIGWFPGNFWFLSSSDAKTGTANPTWHATSFNMGGIMGFSDTINPAGLDGMLWMTCDNHSHDNRDNIYVLCSIGQDANNPDDVKFVRSTDGGNTFSTPIRVNDDPVGQGVYHWEACMSVAKNGRIDAAWLDTRNDPTAATSQLFHSYSLDGGLTWSKNEALSPSFNQSVGYPQQNKLGDYFTVISEDDSANIAYAATFNGEEDIYFVRVPIHPKKDDRQKGNN